MWINTAIKFLNLLFAALLCAPIFAAPNTQLLQRLDIQRGLFADTYQSLDVEGEPSYYVLRENTTAITRGVAVMIADTGVSIVGHEGFAALADELNKIGWVTILLPAPDSGFEPFTSDEAVPGEQGSVEKEPANDNADNILPSDTIADIVVATEIGINKSAVTTIDTRAFAKHEQQLIALLQAAREKSQEYPGFFLVISKGTSAAWLSKIYAEKNLDTPDAFVAVSPYWPDRELNLRLPQWLASTSMPVLDLYSSWDNGWALETANLRKIAAVKALKLQYRQRELLGFTMQSQHNVYLGKEIYGWISHMGW